MMSWRPLCLERKHSMICVGQQSIEMCRCTFSKRSTSTAAEVVVITPDGKLVRFEAAQRGSTRIALSLTSGARRPHRLHHLCRGNTLTIATSLRAIACIRKPHAKQAGSTNLAHQRNKTVKVPSLLTAAVPHHPHAHGSHQGPGYIKTLDFTASPDDFLFNRALVTAFLFSSRSLKIYRECVEKPLRSLSF